MNILSRNGLSVNCCACSRSLSNEKSVTLGIGPVCRSKRQKKLGAQEQLDWEVSKCHHGFNCYNPGHIETAISRINNWRDAWPGWWKATLEVNGAEFTSAFKDSNENDLILAELHAIDDALGLERPGVQIPAIEKVSHDEMYQATGHSLNPINKIASDSYGDAYRIPHDLSAQYWKMKIRELGVCPWGLDCKNPNQAVAATYRILSIINCKIDPLFWRTEYGGLVGCDRRIYEQLADILQMLGLDSEALYILNEDIPRMEMRARKRAPKRYRRAG